MACACLAGRNNNGHTTWTICHPTVWYMYSSLYILSKMKGACTRRTCHSKWLKNVDDINLMHELAGKQIVNRNSCYGNAIYRSAHTRTHTHTQIYKLIFMAPLRYKKKIVYCFSNCIRIQFAFVACNYKLKKGLQHLMVNYLWIKFISLLSTDVTSGLVLPLSLLLSEPHTLLSLLPSALGLIRNLCQI